MEEAAPDFNVGAKGKKQLVDNKLDTMFRGGKVDNYFKVSQRGSNLTTEIRAGITTFLTAAYIMADLDHGAVGEPAFRLVARHGHERLLCLHVGFKGGQNSVKKVMFAVTIEGVIFILMSLFDLRRYVFKVFPTWMMK
ncbi:AZG1, partial [Symbiodinium necroappetens]